LCRPAISNEALGIRLSLTFDPRALPCLTNWQHWGPDEYVTSLEPGTNYPTGQRQAREDGTLIVLEPGETRRYELRFRVDLTQPVS
jgi:hypothetical protein